MDNSELPAIRGASESSSRDTSPDDKGSPLMADASAQAGLNPHREADSDPEVTLAVIQLKPFS